MNTITESNLQFQHPEIAALAKQIWETEGRQSGRDLEYWLRAERQLRAAGGLRPNAPSVPANAGGQSQHNSRVEDGRGRSGDPRKGRQLVRSL